MRDATHAQWKDAELESHRLGVSMPKRRVLGIFGGTFDPIHIGHMRVALETFEQLSLDEVRLIPCKHPPHRAPPVANALHRLHMVSLALEGSKLTLDDREMRREGPSYTLDTVRSLRAEFKTASLCTILGTDAFLTLPTWEAGEQLVELSNIIVMHRSGWALPQHGAITKLLKAHALRANESLDQFEYGKIALISMPTLDIQASRIRALMASNRSVQFLVPDKVLTYIQMQALYGYNERHP